MTHQQCCGRKGEQGFTLVELAIVMIIIGLLIGGILKGQELIANARITSQVSQVKGIDAAMTTFRDQYNALPGDIGNPGRLAGCTAAICSNAGDGNGQIISNAAGIDPTVTDTNVEAARAFVHMAAAGVLGGVSPNLTAYNAAALPTASIGTGMLGIGFSDGTMTQATSATAAAGHYLVHKTGIGANASTTLQPKAVANIDRKLDDNSPLTGSVLAVGGTPGANTCASAAVASTGPSVPAVPSQYNEQLGTGVCGFAIRIQQ